MSCKAHPWSLPNLITTVQCLVCLECLACLPGSKRKQQICHPFCRPVSQRSHHRVEHSDRCSSFSGQARGGNSYVMMRHLCSPQQWHLCDEGLSSSQWLLKALFSLPHNSLPHIPRLELCSLTNANQLFNSTM